jgi:hypothetical protein
MGLSSDECCRLGNIINETTYVSHFDGVNADAQFARDCAAGGSTQEPHQRFLSRRLV